MGLTRAGWAVAGLAALAAVGVGVSTQDYHAHRHIRRLEESNAALKREQREELLLIDSLEMEVRIAKLALGRWAAQYDGERVRLVGMVGDSLYRFEGGDSLGDLESWAYGEEPRPVAVDGAFQEFYRRVIDTYGPWLPVDDVPVPLNFWVEEVPGPYPLHRT